jgi:hypothetical protein
MKQAVYANNLWTPEALHIDLQNVTEITEGDFPVCVSHNVLNHCEMCLDVREYHCKQLLWCHGK